MKVERTIVRIQQAEALYREIENSDSTSNMVNLADTPFFERALELFGPCLFLDKIRIDLKAIFQVAFHRQSKALLVANLGATFASLSPFTSLSYITRHIACSVYHPDLGLETVNVGLIGNVYENDVILRAESACPPSFLFGSQRCNCSYQWASIRELAAYFNPINMPSGLAGEDLERWIEGQFIYRNGQHLPVQEGRGLILMHLDSQAGMGSGFTQGEFVFDLYNRALMRQLGENTTEQIYHTSMKKGYETMGLPPDARRECSEVGYQIPAIILEWLGCNKNLIVLSNNPFKIRQLEQHGFIVKRVKTLGQISTSGQREAKQRGADFQQLDMDGLELTFDEEIARLKTELSSSSQSAFFGSAITG